MTAEPEHISLCTTPVELFNGDEVVSQGTGFYFMRNKDSKKVLFLVTNYHVLTGSSPGECMPPIGDNITFQFHITKENPSVVKTVRMPLFMQNQKPIWFIHKDIPEADLAVVPIPASNYVDCSVSCISSDWTGGELKIRPGSNVMLIGYPYGFYDKYNSLPIWKTGSLASEPSFDFDGKPLIIIDVSAFPGMSGSPAFAVSYGTYETERGPTSVGSVRRFLGIYASMQIYKKQKYLEEISQNSHLGITMTESLELGYVWKSKLIVDTIDGFDIETYEK